MINEIIQTFRKPWKHMNRWGTLAKRGIMHGWIFTVLPEP